MRRSGASLVLLGAIVLTSAVPASPAYAAWESIARASVSTSSAQTTGELSSSAISGNGRYVAFATDAADVVAGDTNGVWDIFVRDLTLGTTTRVSVASDGSQSNNLSDLPSISADGRYVAFMSEASNLVPGDTNGTTDIFVRDMLAGTTSRASLADDESQAALSSVAPSISANGRYVAFASSAGLVPEDTNLAHDVYVRDLVDQTTSRVSIATDGSQTTAISTSESASISADGRYVAFISSAGNLVDGDTNSSVDVFVHDRTLHETKRVSVTSTGAQVSGSCWAPSIAANGEVVVFESLSSGLVPGDTNSALDVFVFDRVTSETNRVSLASDGSQAPTGASSASISADGRYVGFSAILPGFGSAGDVFVRDRTLAVTTCVSVNAAGTPGDGMSIAPALSSDGATVAFRSYATNLVAGDTNGTGDIFVRGAAPTPPPAALTPVYRFFRPSTGTHFYTMDENEMVRVRDTMKSTYTLDGVGYYINRSNPANSLPLYRYFNTRTGTHLYTADPREIAVLPYWYQLDGVAYNISMVSGTRVHRFYSPSKGVHFYSSDPDEIAYVRASLGHIWTYEGPAYMVGQ